MTEMKVKERRELLKSKRLTYIARYKKKGGAESLKKAQMLQAAARIIEIKSEIEDKEK